MIYLTVVDTADSEVAHANPDGTIHVKGVLVPW